MHSLSKDMILEPILKWPGGKRHTANRLVKMLPPHDTYVEPFAGGAAVFFRKPLVKRNVLGDADPWLIDFYKGVRNGGLRNCAGGIRKSRGLFKRSLKNQKSVCHKLSLSHLSFHGDRKSFTGNAKNDDGKLTQLSKLRRFKEYQKKLRKSYVRLDDFAKTMRKFDGPRTLHFLDPPWLLDYSDTMYHSGIKSKIKKHRGTKTKGTSFDPEHLKKVSDKMKGYVFIIINNHPKIRKLFCKSKGWKCSTIKASVNKGRLGSETQKQLIITKDFRKAR